MPRAGGVLKLEFEEPGVSLQEESLRGDSRQVYKGKQRTLEVTSERCMHVYRNSGNYGTL